MNYIDIVNELTVLNVNELTLLINNLEKTYNKLRTLKKELNNFDNSDSFYKIINNDLTILNDLISASRTAYSWKFSSNNDKDEKKLVLYCNNFHIN